MRDISLVLERWNAGALGHQWTAPVLTIHI